MYQALPDTDLLEDGDLSNQFRGLGIHTFHDACDFVWKLPYGRTSDRADWKLVLPEKTGSCSTKHALLKALADELSLDVNLIMGIYAMKEANTPGVGQVLSKYNIEYIPEAHCYLEYQGRRIDLTRYGFDSDEQITEFFVEKKISPIDIGEVKQNFHKDYLWQQYVQEGFETIWSIREQCIAALSTNKFSRSLTRLPI